MPSEMPVCGADLHVTISFDSRSLVRRSSRLSLAVTDLLGNTIICCSTEMTLAHVPSIGSNDIALCRIPALPLTGGHYLLTLFLEQDGIIQDWISGACQFEVVDADFFGFGKNVPTGYNGRIVLVSHSWSFSENISDQFPDSTQDRADAPSY